MTGRPPAGVSPGVFLAARSGTVPTVTHCGGVAGALLRPAYAHPLIRAVRQASLAVIRTAASGLDVRFIRRYPLRTLLQGRNVLASSKLQAQHANQIVAW